MSVITITGGTVIGDASMPTYTLQYKTITFKAPLIEIRSGSKDGPLLARLTTAGGDFANTGDRHEGAAL